jgi:hypothetical protein
MAKEISVNSMELVQATTNSQTAINNINVNLDEWSNQGESSIALQAFSKQFVELEKVMQLYQKLLDQDVDSIKNRNRNLSIRF